MITSLTFFACTPVELPEFSCAGVITIENSGLDGVVIKSNLRELASTNAAGEFTFTTNAKSLTIIPQKEGYMFEPAKAELKEGQNTANFVAIKVKNLTGTLILSKVVITPTSIVSFGDNYQYLNNGSACLKASAITINYGEQNVSLISQPTYLNKSQENTLPVTGDIRFECGTRQTIGLLINTYFRRYNNEWQTYDTEFINLYITKPQTNKDVTSGKIVYNMYGINNKSKSFTFDVTFIFKYMEG